MQYQVLSALHDVLKRDIDEANQPGETPGEDRELRYCSRGSFSGIHLCIQINIQVPVRGIGLNSTCFAGDGPMLSLPSPSRDRKWRS